MITTQLEQIEGKWYLVTRVDGVIMRQQAADPVPTAEATHSQRVKQMLSSVEDKVFPNSTTLTALERDRLIVLIARMLYQKSF